MTRSYHASRTIDAPASTVWALLTDAATYTDWNHAVVSIEGPIREGNTIKLVSIVNPKRTFTPRVTQMTARSRMVWSDGMPLGLFKGERTYTITHLGSDRCEFKMAEQFTGALAGLITRATPDLTDGTFLHIADMRGGVRGPQPRSGGARSSLLKLRRRG